MERVVRNLHLISNFHKQNTKRQKAIQKSLNNDEVKFLCELCINILNNNLKIDESLKSKLFPHRTKLRKLADPKQSLKKKKKIVYTGGFVPFLLSTLSSSLVGLALEKLAKKYATGENKNS